MVAADERIRVTILGGFLGAGKTTWLRHQLHAGRFPQAMVIVNEAADAPVDDALLAAAGELRVLAGGCACCDGKDALLALLRRVADRRSNATTACDGIAEIILETSGLADPRPIVEAIRQDPVLQHHLVVAHIVVLVDAVFGRDELAREPLSRRQVELADELIVTKIDAARETEVAELHAQLSALNPLAALSGSRFGSAERLPPPAVGRPEAPETEPEPGARPVVRAVLPLDDTVDWTAFAVWLSALLHARGEDILRVKGVAQTPAGRILLQAVRTVVQAPQRLPDSVDSGGAGSMVVMGRGFTQDALLRSLHAFTGERAPATELRRPDLQPPS